MIIKWSGIFALAFMQRSGSSVGYPEYSGLPVTKTQRLIENKK